MHDIETLFTTMTTIILDKTNKTLYADCKEIYGTSIYIPTIKIVPLRLKNNRRIGFIAMSGASYQCETYLRYLSTIENLHEIKDFIERRPEWKKLGGIIALKDGITYTIAHDGTIIPFHGTYMADGAGQEAAMVCLQAEIPIEMIFYYISKVTSHTSEEFHFVKYTEPNAEIQYSKTQTR